MDAIRRQAKLGDKIVESICNIWHYLTSSHLFHGAYLSHKAGPLFVPVYASLAAQLLKVDLKLSGVVATEAPPKVLHNRFGEKFDSLVAIVVLENLEKERP